MAGCASLAAIAGSGFTPIAHLAAPLGLSPRERVDALVDVVVNKYAPLPALSLSYGVRRLRYAVPQWRTHLPGALERARRRLAHADVDGVRWYWPDGESTTVSTEDDIVRLLAPFDPVVWDRRRFEAFWSWPYRFEAYTPVAKRKFGYYALPLLWREQVIGWANVTAKMGSWRLCGYTAGSAPKGRGFRTGHGARARSPGAIPALTPGRPLDGCNRRGLGF